jgi:hypothetical protein
MQRNLDELPALAAFAAEHGIEVLAVHPLIGRDPLPLGAAVEHTADGVLEAGFRERLIATVAAARERAPNVAIQLSSHELMPTTTLAAQPQPWPWPLPADARIGGCDQSPFDSVHVLADGRVIACEVTEKVALGDLREHSLREIWNGPAYRAFRQRHLDGIDPACHSCVYKQAYRPQRAQARLDAAQLPAAQLLRGWHADDGSGVRWSSAGAALWLPRPRWQRHLRLRGRLATPMAAQAQFEVRIDGCVAHRQVWREAMTIDLRLPLPPAGTGEIVVELECRGAGSPHALGQSGDVRQLGFALIALETAW